MRNALAAAAIGAALTLGLTAPGFANPGEAADPVVQFLQDKGFVATRVAPSASASQPSPASALVDGSAEPKPAASLFGRVRDRASELVVQAMGYVGVRYKRGGTSAETGFDCSGFVQHVYNASLGLVLPRRADEQATDTNLAKVDRADLRPGDLVFFNTMRRTFSHVGIYIGGNRFIHSPRTGEDVRTEDMTFSYWARRFTGARRVIEPAAPANGASAAGAAS